MKNRIILNSALALACAAFIGAAHAQDAVATARTAFRNATSKINADYKSAVSKCSGAEKTSCIIDARTSRAKARADALGARDKAYAKANISGSAFLEEEPYPGGD